MRTLVYATALGALLMATSAQAAVTLDFAGNTSTWVLYQGQKVVLDDGGGSVANKVQLTPFVPAVKDSKGHIIKPAIPATSTYYGATTVADVQVDGSDSASFTSGVAGRGDNPSVTNSTPWGANASSTSGIIATLTNTGATPVHLNSIQSTIIQAGMGFMIQNPTGPAFDNDVFTGYGMNDTGKFGDFYKPALAGKTIANAGFNFNVYGDDYGTVGEEATPLYTLKGSVSLGFDLLGDIVETSDVTDAKSILSGFAPIYPKLDGFGHPILPYVPITNLDRIAGYEWNETNVNVALSTLLGAGLSTNLYYVATSYVDVALPCVSATECLVAYSGFGDPVGRGGGVEADFASSISTFSSLLSDPCPHDTSRICFSPQTITPFSNLKTSGGVPEPATWVSMIVGFGLAGAALRRRGALSHA
jgi:hypothetical protein